MKPGRADDGAGRPRSGIGFEHESIGRALDAFDCYRTADWQLVAFFVFGEVVQRVVARRIPIRPTRHDPAGKRAEARRGEEMERRKS